MLVAGKNGELLFFRLLCDVECLTASKFLTLVAHGGLPIVGAALSADGSTAATSGSDCTINIWDVESGSVIRQISKTEVYVPSECLGLSWSGSTRVSPDKNHNSS